MDDSGTPEERRSKARAPIELRVEYKRLNSFFADYTRNISRGGTCIRTDKPLAIGTEFVFNLAVPRRSDPLRLVGKVVWIVTAEQATPDRPPGMGIEFIYQNDSERARVDAWVGDLMREELGEEIAAGLLEERDDK